MISSGFGKNPFVVDLKAEPEAFLEVREPCRSCAGALKDGLIDLDLDMAWDIDGSDRKSVV